MHLSNDLVSLPASLSTYTDGTVPHYSLEVLGALIGVQIEEHRTQHSERVALLNSEKFTKPSDLVHKMGTTLADHKPDQVPVDKRFSRPSGLPW